MTKSLRVNQSKLLTDMALCVDYYRQFTVRIIAAIQYGVSRKGHHDFMATIWSQ
ncbi:MAG: hypothetical protein GKR89_34385 [Candidatus Latescibacteria bacterium]|nr:hypothetical protein [Candidatus Latescibacterota bacterium]